MILITSRSLYIKGWDKLYLHLSLHTQDKNSNKQEYIKIALKLFVKQGMQQKFIFYSQLSKQKVKNCEIFISHAFLVAFFTAKICQQKMLSHILWHLTVSKECTITQMSLGGGEEEGSLTGVLQ